MEEKIMPSGAVLRVSLAPFADAKRLYQAVLEEMRSLNLEADREIEIALIRELFCTGFSSKKIDAALASCLSRALYNDVRIGDSTFEEEKAREDYLQVCFEVAYANLRPFMKNLGSLLKSALTRVADLPTQSSNSTKTGS